MKMISESLGTKKLMRCTSCHAEILEEAEHHMVVNKGGFVSLLCGFCYISNKEHVVGVSKEIIGTKPRPINSKPISSKPVTHSKSWSRLRTISDKDLEALREDYRKGGPIKDLALKYNLGTSTLTKYLFGVRRDYPIFGPRPKLPPEEIAELKQKYRAGADRNDLMKEYNLSSSTFYKYLQIPNITLPREVNLNPFRISRRRKKLGKDQIKEIVEKYAKGATIRALADEYKISYSSVKNYYKEGSLNNPIMRLRGKPTLLSPEQIKTLKQEHARGGLPADLANKYNISLSTFSRYINDITIRNNPHKRFPKSFKDLYPASTIAKPPLSEIDRLKQEKKLLDIERATLAKQVKELKEQAKEKPKRLSFREKLIKMLGGK
jgi:DNA invertase Pin-like site-specific DNA recombinase